MADDSGEAAAAHEEIADTALAPTDFAPTADTNDAKRQRTGDAAMATDMDVGYDTRAVRRTAERR
jgi:hypothetical protein